MSEISTKIKQALSSASGLKLSEEDLEQISTNIFSWFESNERSDAPFDFNIKDFATHSKIESNRLIITITEASCSPLGFIVQPNAKCFIVKIKI